MELWGETLTFGIAFFLFLALAMALGFEFVNGFHDTANAVATVIYTNSLPATVAVVWSGICNLTGVLLSTGGVAYGIIALLPVDLVLHIGSGAGFAMVFALLLSAIIWNVGTWYMGLPASSSHTLIGSIMGVGIANALMSGHAFGDGINWAKAQETGIALVLSPIVGFVCSALLLLLLKSLIKNPALFQSPEKGQTPPWWIRGILILTCTGVSYSHGSNDGQKGMGLIMLILIGLVPAGFALKMDASPEILQKTAIEARQVNTSLQATAGDTTISEEDATKQLSDFVKPSGKFDPQDFAAIVVINNQIATKLEASKTFNDISKEDRRTVRTETYLVSAAIDKLLKGKKVADADVKTFKTYHDQLDGFTKYIPQWVMVAVALSLGMGTMIGWKRIVVTVGEKIGKSHLTYAQGACAELVAAITIYGATQYKWPVSTTHILSSGVAGTMAANGSGLQKETMRNILMAWVLTLPVCMFLGGSLFAAAFYVIFNIFGLK
jgi:PiT family inorganic phosphate transporter